MKSTLDMRIGRAANWFYIIAALSIVNSVLAATNSSFVFIIGLGVTQVGAGMARQMGNSAIAIAVDAGAVLLLVAFGYFGARRHAWAFVIGMLLYAVDGALFVMVRDWFAIAFHVLALYFMYQGLVAVNLANQNQRLMRDMAIRASLEKDAHLRAAGPAPSASTFSTADAPPVAQAWRPSLPQPPEEPK